MTEPSATTSELIRLLTERDAKGRAKYGTTLDRTDLTHAEWLQHMVEELLDAAGYALVAKREADRDADRSIDECIESTKAFIGAVESSNELLAALHRQRAENAVLRDARDVLKRECSALKAENLKLRNALAGYRKYPDECSDPDGGGACVADMAHHELTKQLEAAGWRWDDDADSWVGPDDVLRAENERLREALDWYAVKVNDCRKLGKDGDMARGSLDKDGGSVARAALKGDSHD